MLQERDDVQLSQSQITDKEQETSSKNEEVDLDKIEKSEKIERTYDIEGLLIGGGVGAVVGIIISFNIIFAIQIGMFFGLIVGTRFKKKSKNKSI
ncbi:MAG: hypothetical protein LBL77_00885 [Endomicrobium sp.]|nr:hypothetical protein [Endomicrobium sp.]